MGGDLIIGQRFHIYTPLKKLPVVNGRWSAKIAGNIVVPAKKLPAWMIEPAAQVGMIEPGTLLPTGVVTRSPSMKCRGLTH